MANFFYQILEMSLRGSYVILILLLARLLLRRAPRRILSLLWLVAFFRLICPVSFSAIFSLMPSGETLTPPQTLLNSVLWTGNAAQSTAQGYLGISQTRVTLMSILPVIWLIGAAGMAAASLISLWRLRRSLQSAVRTPDGVWELEGLPTAFIVGLFRPRIYLPAGLCAEERELVLRHERTHLRRGDWLVKLAAHLILCLHWFNPLVWAAFRLLCRDIEISCDEQVIRQLGEARRAAYSRTLLHLAGGPSYRGALAFGEGDVKGRIRHLLSGKKRTIALTVCCGALAAVLAVTLLFDPADSRPQWLRQLQTDQLVRAELIHAREGEVSAVWFEGEQLEPLTEALRDAKASADWEGGLAEELLDSAVLPQMDGLYLLMRDGTVHLITSVDGGESRLFLDGVQYTAQGSWAKILQQQGEEKGASPQMTQAVEAQQELLRRPLQQLTDSASYEAESGTLTFTVPQELEEQEIRLNLTLLTADGEQWQGFSQENSENSWVPGQTYTAQIDGLEQMVVLCNLGGVSISSSVGFTAEKGYQGIGMSNLPQG